MRTPEPVEDQVSDDDDDCDDDSNGNTADADKLPKERTPKKPKSLESMNELWAATHSKQVRERVADVIFKTSILTHYQTTKF